VVRAISGLPHLNAMNVKFGLIAPWPLTSYARAIQQPALEKMEGEETNLSTAQNSFIIGLV